MSTQAQSGQVEAGVARWEIDPVHSEVEFSVRHLMVSTVKGRFADVSGYVEFDPENPATASVEATINAASIDTRSEDRDNHLRSADFFDVEKYPTITFKSTRVEAAGGNRYRVIGDLTMHGVTREVTLDAEFHGTHPDPYGGVRAGFSASTKINRTDFGLTWNAALETGGVMVSEEVKINLELETVRQG